MFVILYLPLSPFKAGINDLKQTKDSAANAIKLNDIEKKVNGIEHLKTS